MLRNEIYKYFSSLVLFIMYLRRFPQLRTLQSHSFHSSSHLKALSSLAIPKAEQISSQWKGTSATGGTTKNFIGGEFIESKTTEWIDTHDPVRKYTREIQANA